MSFISSFKSKGSKIDKNVENESETGCIDDSEYVENVSIGNYIIIKELGSGSTAKVVLAFEKNTNRKVAIKIVKRKQIDAKDESSYEQSNSNKSKEQEYKRIPTPELQDDSPSHLKDNSSISECSSSSDNPSKKKSRRNKKTIDFASIEQKGTSQNESRNDKSGFTDLRIYREIVISSLLDHPHIVKLLDFFYSNSYFFLVFEHVEGTQLYDVILKNTRIHEDKARKYFRQILSAIEYIHGNSTVHRDLKIENIIIDQNDNVKILDFGLSNFYDNKKFFIPSVVVCICSSRASHG